MDITELIRLTLSMGLPCCLLALGVFLTFRILDFADMTAEGSLLIGGAACALMITKNVPPLIATFVGMLAGGVCGFITGFLNRVLKIPKLLSGIITMTASGSIALLLFGIANGRIFASEINGIDNSKTIFGFLDPKIFHGWQQVMVVAVIVAIVLAVAYFFFGTEYGMAIRATGINEKMAKSQGINTTVTTIICVSISNALIGLAGALIAQIDSGMNAQGATGYLVVGLASILIGETLFGKRSFKNALISISLGSILYFAIIMLATQVFKMPTDLTKLLYAFLIALALCLPMIKQAILKLWARISPPIKRFFKKLFVRKKKKEAE